MSKINLLPWRKKYQLQQKKDFLMGLFASLLMAIITLFFIHKIIVGKIITIKKGNEVKNIQMTKIDNQLQQYKISQEQYRQTEQMLSVIQEIQERQQQFVELFPMLPKIMPAGLYLTNMKGSKNEIILTGKTNANAEIALLVRELEKLPWLDTVKLMSMGDATDKSQETNFQIKIFLRSSTFIPLSQAGKG